MNLQKRSLLEQKSQGLHGKEKEQKLSISNIQKPLISKLNKIGKPGYKVMKIRHPISNEIGLLINVKFDKLNNHEIPNYRFMSCFETNLDKVKNGNYQYLIISGDPYENIGFKIPSKEIYRNDDGDDDDDDDDDDNGNGNNDINNKFFTFWDKDTKEFYIQFFYKNVS